MKIFYARADHEAAENRIRITFLLILLPSLILSTVAYQYTMHYFHSNIFVISIHLIIDVLLSVDENKIFHKKLLVQRYLAQIFDYYLHSDVIWIIKCSANFILIKL